MGLTVPELFVRSVQAQAAEATLEDMLDTILSARALLHPRHHLLQRHHNIQREIQEINHRKSQNKNKNHTLLLCSSKPIYYVSSVIQTSCYCCCQHSIIIIVPLQRQSNTIKRTRLAQTEVQAQMSTAKMSGQKLEPATSY